MRQERRIYWNETELPFERDCHVCGETMRKGFMRELYSRGDGGLTLMYRESREFVCSEDCMRLMKVRDAI